MNNYYALTRSELEKNYGTLEEYSAKCWKEVAKGMFTEEDAELSIQMYRMDLEHVNQK